MRSVAVCAGGVWQTIKTCGAVRDTGVAALEQQADLLVAQLGRSVERGAIRAAAAEDAQCAEAARFAVQAHALFAQEVDHLQLIEVAGDREHVARVPARRGQHLRGVVAPAEVGEVAGEDDKIRRAQLRPEPFDGLQRHVDVAEGYDAHRSESYPVAHRVATGSSRSTRFALRRGMLRSRTMPLNNIRVVLLRPRGAANVGAVARAMKNMGLRDLVLVHPALMKSFWARAMAAHAEDVLHSVRRCDSIGDAVADCGLVVGTTCRGGLYREAAEPPRVAAPRMVAAAATNRVALVFGPEDHGLSNEDLKACQQLIAIPADPAYPSLNLAQAVMVCCYELRLAVAGEPQATRELARAEQVDRMFEKLRAALALHRLPPSGQSGSHHVRLPSLPGARRAGSARRATFCWAWRDRSSGSAAAATP